MIHFAAFCLMLLFSARLCDQAKNFNQFLIAMVSIYTAVLGMSVSLFIYAATKAVYYVYPLI